MKMKKMPATRNAVKSLAMAAVAVTTATGCQTTDPVAKMNAASGAMELYSSADSYSMITPEHEFINDQMKISSGSDSLVSLNNKAQLMIAKGETGEAEKVCYEILLQDFKNIEAKISLAQISLIRGELSKSKLILNNLGDIRKKDSRILNLLGMIAVRSNENAMALANFKEGLQINPEDLAIRMNLGVLYMHYRQINQAATQFERILSKVPGHVDAQVHLAIVDMARGQPEKAKEVLARLAEGRKAAPLADYNYARVLDQQEKYEDALDRIQKFLENAPKDSERVNAAFKMAEAIQRKQEAAGQEVSREEIQALAEKFNTTESEDKPQTASKSSQPIKAEEAVAKDGEIKQEKPTPAPAQAQPIQTEPASYELEEIDQLEKQLQ